MNRSRPSRAVGARAAGGGASPRAASAPPRRSPAGRAGGRRRGGPGSGRLRMIGRTASTKRALPPGVRRSWARAWTSIRWSTIGRAVRTSSRQRSGSSRSDLVGVLARRAAGRPGRRPARRRSRPRGELADELLERRRAERARLLAGRVDVVGERDPLRVAGDERDLLRASARCRGSRRRSRSPPGGPSARRCSPRRSRPGRVLRIARLGAVDRGTASGSCRTAASPGELRYFGPRSTPPSPSLPRIRPPRPTAWPFASRIGKMTRSRNRS